jgi:hypothetical protein
MFVDSGLKAGRRYQYYVRAVDKSGQEGQRSEWAGVTVTDKGSSTIVTFEPLYKQGVLAPVFGDLDGDGTLDCVIRLDNGNHEMSQDPGLPVQLEAFTSYGRSLWRKDLCYHDHCYGSANNVPFNVWDMDGDGKAEVITRLQIGDEVYVAILDGMTGQVKYKTKWPDMVSDFAKSSTRIHLSIAYLDGKHPAVVTQTGLYENEVLVAYDNQLKELWRFNSFAETSGSGGHKIEVADVDGDGCQEVFDGTTCLNHDGTVRWSIYRQHPDIVSIHDYLPERPAWRCSSSWSPASTPVCIWSMPAPARSSGRSTGKTIRAGRTATRVGRRISGPARPGWNASPTARATTITIWSFSVPTGACCWSLSLTVSRPWSGTATRHANC